MKLYNLRQCILQHVAMKRGVLRSLAKQYAEAYAREYTFTMAVAKTNIRREGQYLAFARELLAEIDRDILADYLERLRK